MTEILGELHALLEERFSSLADEVGDEEGGLVAFRLGFATEGDGGDLEVERAARLPVKFAVRVAPGVPSLRRVLAPPPGDGWFRRSASSGWEINEEGIVPAGECVKNATRRAIRMEGERDGRR